MAASPRPQGQFLLAVHQQSLYVRVLGLATLQNCPALQDLVEELRGRGFRRFVFDLASCTGFDSTFMGILLEAVQAREPSGGAGGQGAGVVLVNASPEHRRLLEEVGVDRVVRLRADPVDFPSVELQKLEEGEQDPRRRIRAILLAHENLVRLGGANVEKFGATLDMLRRELGGDAVLRA